MHNEYNKRTRKTHKYNKADLYQTGASDFWFIHAFLIFFFNKLAQFVCQQHPEWYLEWIIFTIKAYLYVEPSPTQ